MHWLIQYKNRVRALSFTWRALLLLVPMGLLGYFAPSFFCVSAGETPAPETRPTPPDPNLKQNIDRLQHQQDASSQALTKLQGEISSSTNAPTATAFAPVLQALQTQLQQQQEELQQLRAQAAKPPQPAPGPEKGPSPSFEERSFWATTALTIAALILAILGIGSYEKRAETIAEEAAVKAATVPMAKADLIDHTLPGRLYLTVSLVFRLITWDSNYRLNNPALDFGTEALKKAEEALLIFRNANYKPYLVHALNNVIFYRSLLARGNMAMQTLSPGDARDLINLANELRTMEGFSSNPIFVNTYCRAFLTAARFLDGGSPQAILSNLDWIEGMLRANRDTCVGGNRLEAVRLLDELTLLRRTCQGELPQPPANITGQGA